MRTIRFSILTALFCVSCTTNSTNSEGQRTAASAGYSIHEEEPDSEMGESLEPNENQSIQKVIDEAMVALKRDFHPPKVPRDAHAKSHGCLQSTFSIDNKNLPEELRVGLFAQNATYPAWLRFSNNTSDPMSNDRDLDLRGIAIKLMNVSGEKILPNESTEATQDFLMFASPIFFVKDIKDYSEFIKALGMGKAINDLIFRPKSLIELATAQLKAATKMNPLSLTYYSATPYRLGDLANPNRKIVKYSVSACDGSKSEPQGSSLDHDFMRHALVKSLSTHEACFKFQVQVGDPKRQDLYNVEDPSVLWPASPTFLGNQTFSPYKTVATLKIPKQTFDTPERDQFCERLSYTPWHTLNEHRPLGRTNRMRRKLYEYISNYRHQANGVQKLEPKSLDIKTAFD